MSLEFKWACGPCTWVCWFPPGGGIEARQTKERWCATDDLHGLAARRLVSFIFLNETFELFYD
jgi:hypothetical protein